MTKTTTATEQLRRETPGADGFDPDDEDIATTTDNGVTTLGNAATRLHKFVVDIIAELAELPT